jgi:hypothetical protein
MASAEHAATKPTFWGAFDPDRDVVEAAAIKVYARGHKDPYNLLMVDLWAAFASDAAQN